MKRKINNVPFSVLSVIAALSIVLPLALPRLFGPIWSWEGFLRTTAIRSKKLWLLFCGVLLLTSVIVLCAIQIPAGFWKKLGNIKWVLLCIAVVISAVVFPRHIPLSARWFEQHYLVAHAGGRSPNGYTYVNSLESFELNYQQGHRVFEGDLCLTADGVLVLEHDWPHWCKKTGVEYTGQAVSYDQFMASRFYGAETPMDVTSLINLMLLHEDMYFMTDFKYCYEQADVKSGFRQIVQAAKDAGRTDILARFIIQNHHNDFKPWVDQVYPFENWLYTYYSIGDSEDRLPENLVAYCRRENIPVITMWENMPDDLWFGLTQPHNIQIFAHTVNDPARSAQLIQAGVAGIYTDDIKPGEGLPAGS